MIIKCPHCGNDIQLDISPTPAPIAPETIIGASKAPLSETVQKIHQDTQTIIKAIDSKK